VQYGVDLPGGTTDARDSAAERDDKMATGSTDRSADIMYVDGTVGPHVDIYE